MLRIVAAIGLLVVVRFWISGLDSVVSQSGAYLRIAGILIAIIIAGRLIGTAVGLKWRKTQVRQGRTAVVPRVEAARTRVA